MNRAVFFDRDGILNRIVMRGNKVGSPRSVEEVKFMEGAERLVELAKSRGYLTIMITNQPDVGRGFLERAELERIHDFLNEKYRLDGIEVCCSGDDSDPRRKPNPGMLLDAAVQHRVDLQSSFFIGDSVKDLEAGKRAGVKTILLQTEYNLEYHGQGDFNCNSVNDALSIVGTEFTTDFLLKAQKTARSIDTQAIEDSVAILKSCRARGGRLFLIGSGGGAGHASHAACDFRKLCGIEAYCPTDNVSELTARINDEGWETSLSNYLRGSRLAAKDCVLVFSVGGGDEQHAISVNLVNAVKLAKDVGAQVIGIVGREQGFTAKAADACVVVPTVDSSLLTPMTEAFQAVIWHLIASHPDLQLSTAKWESTTA